MLAYTAIIGEYDSVKNQPITDAPFVIVNSVPFDGTNVMRARWAKLMAHRLFPGVEYILWVDGSMRLHAPCSMGALVAQHLAEHDLAVMKHPFLDCLYDDCLACLKAGKASFEQVKATHAHYEAIRYPRGIGHTEHGMMLRRMTKPIIELCEAWFSELVRTQTTRDQWHMAPIARNMGVQYKVIPERFFDVERHTPKQVRKRHNARWPKGFL